MIGLQVVVLLLVCQLARVTGRGDEPSILEMMDQRVVSRLLQVQAARARDRSRNSDLDGSSDSAGKNERQPALPWEASQPLGQPSSPASVIQVRGSRRALVVAHRELLRRAWCTKAPLVLRVRRRGCLTQDVRTHFCYGHCDSFFIPRGRGPRRRRRRQGGAHQGHGSDADAASFSSCARCGPQAARWQTVVLRCPQLTPPSRRKRVLVPAGDCRCTAHAQSLHEQVPWGGGGGGARSLNQVELRGR